MNTAVLSAASGADLIAAAEMLKGGGVVAIPTETVYGLAANALDKSAVKKIFLAKGRPQDNPVIVHIAHAKELESICTDIPKAAFMLAESFWPGPLTMVLKRAPHVPPETAAGLDTLGVRVPGNEAALELIKLCGFPLAAPSANTSGRPSPTSAQHVLEDLNGKIDAVLDGGRCPVGVESTVIDMTSVTPCILRPGDVTREQIEKVIGPVDIQRGQSADKPRSPGLKYRHYAPSVPVLAYSGPPQKTAERIKNELLPGDGVLCFDELKALFEGRENIAAIGKSYDAGAQGSRLFAALRELEGAGVSRILAQCPKSTGRHAAVYDRMVRACSGSIERVSNVTMIGVTGRSGSGKSLFCKEAEKKGFGVFDADLTYARLLRESGELNTELYERFPRAFENGVFSRRKMAQAAFNDETALKDLNRITHAYVRREMYKIIADFEKSKKNICLDIPLLFQGGLYLICDVTVSVISDISALKSRIMQRDGLSEDSAELRLKNQPENDYYLQRSDIVIENTGDIAAFTLKSQNVLSGLK